PSFTRDDVRELLRSTLRHNGKDVKPGIHSLGLDPYFSGRNASQVATITLSRAPECFIDTKDEWTLPTPRSEASDEGLATSSVTIDNHFRGFTPLNSI